MGLKYLVPCFIQHNRATYWNTGFVRQEVLEGLFMVVTPMAEEWANVEETV